MKISEELRADLRALAKKYPAGEFVGGLAEFLADFATRGIAAERAGKKAAGKCPRCRENQQLLRETRERLGAGVAQGGRADADTETS